MKIKKLSARFAGARCVSDCVRTYVCGLLNSLGLFFALFGLFVYFATLVSFLVVSVTI